VSATAAATIECSRYDEEVHRASRHDLLDRRGAKVERLDAFQGKRSFSTRSIQREA